MKGNHTTSLNSKYQFTGDLEKGKVSLTIHNVSLGDSGKYCCRLEYTEPSNNKHVIIDLNVTDDREVGFTERYKTTGSKITTSQAEDTTAIIDGYTDIGDKDSDKKRGNISADSQSDSGSWRAMEFSQHLLGNRSIWKGLDVTERRKVANSYLQEIGNAVIAAAQHSQKKEIIKLSKPTLDLEISFIERHNITGNKTVTLEAKGDTLNVDPYTILGDKDSATLAFISYSNLDSIIGPELVVDESNVSKNLQPSEFYSRVVTVLCATVAGGLHYLFLAAFFWMCLEAVQLCLMVLNLKVVNFSRTRVIPRRLMYPIGYGCPAVIVIVTAAVNAKGYGTDRM
ncbi:hypothetical protein chiPu_0018170 [Chiloscyllium punctatum]|uniref:G-protein coupled receptors family 2 profile 2 domain-containing protein n=1 Tax=Chiloscyllium punctatum TaxID=137246 RepID=A0A401RLJ2_CHIPU|nr:hypothetical protein [Chiloscyllium punctatum]